MGLRADQDAEHIWRVSGRGRFGAVVVAVFWLALASGITAGGGATAGTVALLWVVFVVVIVCVWRWAFVPYVALTRGGVVVQNRLLRTVVPYDDINDVRPGYAGLTIVRRSGGSVTAWAVQKSNLRTWQRRHDTRADEAARRIAARAGLPE